MAIEIVEVLERSSQGQTRPYVCRGDDDEVYFVKGRSATRVGLITELLAAQLATGFGLPIAPWQIAEVSPEIIATDTTGRLNDLGAGAVFASRRVAGVEFSRSHIESVPLQTRRDIVVFDWWIRNGDRILTHIGGNPNLIWDPASSRLTVIDHNLAFDASFESADLLDHHVFSDEVREAFSDFELRDQYRTRMQ